MLAKEKVYTYLDLYIYVDCLEGRIVIAKEEEDKPIYVRSLFSTIVASDFVDGKLVVITEESPHKYEATIKIK